MSRLGSSPRIRGEWSLRHIPDPHFPDHPREYGENLAVASSLPSLTGSSPRIRGECSRQVRWLARLGIIPANTGRITTPIRSLITLGDHPREYGENTLIMWVHWLSAGSSPRIRGESDRTTDHGIRLGIIPANTGRIVGPGGFWGAFRDHPREYGENSPE